MQETVGWSCARASTLQQIGTRQVLACQPPAWCCCMRRRRCVLLVRSKTDLLHLRLQMEPCWVGQGKIDRAVLRCAQLCAPLTAKFVQRTQQLVRACLLVLFTQAVALWSYVLTTAMGVQRLLIQLVLQGLLPGEQQATDFESKQRLSRCSRCGQAAVQAQTLFIPPQVHLSLKKRRKPGGWPLSCPAACCVVVLQARRL